jgi:hypothetical protein
MGSEGLLLFEKHPVLQETGDHRASNVDVPASCFVFNLSEDTRVEHSLVISGILIWDDYHQVLDNICNFADDEGLLLHIHEFSSGEFKNPFLNTNQLIIIGRLCYLTT